MMMACGVMLTMAMLCLDDIIDSEVAYPDSPLTPGDVMEETSTTTATATATPGRRLTSSGIGNGNGIMILFQERWRSAWMG